MASALELPITPTVGGVLTASAVIGATAVLVGWILYATAPPLKVEVYQPGEGTRRMSRKAREMINRRK